VDKGEDADKVGPLGGKSRAATLTSINLKNTTEDLSQQMDSIWSSSRQPEALTNQTDRMQ